MAKPKKTRSIRFDQFTKQLDETGIAELQPVELNGDGDKIYIRLGVGIDVDATNEFMERLNAMDTAEEAAQVILGEHPSITADEQIELMEKNGFNCAQLVALWGSATADMRDEMGKLRPRKS